MPFASFRHHLTQPTYLFLPVSIIVSIIMSEYDQPIRMGTEDPEYYAELFCRTSRLANRRLPYGERFCPDIAGIQGVDGPLSRRLQALLDSLADISLCQRGNVSAAMACLKVDDKGTSETLLHIAFNHEDDESASRCTQHLHTIFEMLRQVPYKPPAVAGSPKVIANELENDFIEICKAIHDYSFDIFAYRVSKREHILSNIREFIEQDRTHFTPEERSTLVDFLENVGQIIMKVANSWSGQVSTNFIRMLLSMYSYWTEHDLLPKDLLADKKVKLLDRADEWLAEGG